MRYIGSLIEESQRDTNNAGSSSTSGVSPEDFLRYMQNGQERLFALILQENSEKFQSQEILPLVADQESYTLTSNLYLDRIVNVEFSTDGTVRNYVKLPEVSIVQRNTYPQSYPSAYYRQNGKVCLVPVPSQSTGSIRVTFEEALDSPTLRRGRVNGTPSGLTIDLTHSTFGAPSTENEALFVEGAYVCVSDIMGNVMMKNGIIDSYTAASDAITLTSNVSNYLVGSYALANLANGFLTVGKHTTTHSKLLGDLLVAERYLIAYCNWKVFGRNAATAEKAKVFETELNGIESEILNSFKQSGKDLREVNVTNSELMLLG